MKKLLSLILVALMILPFGVFASIGASADGEDVIYVKAGGKGDGSSPDSAVGTIDAATKLAAKKTNDVTIKIVGKVTLDASAFADNKYIEPAHTNKITWAGNDADSLLTIKTTDAARYYSLGGDWGMKDLAVEMDGAKVLCIITNLYDVYVDTGVTIVNNQSTIDTITMCGALHTHYENEFYDAATKTHTANPTITVKSGSFKQLVPYFLNASNKATDIKLNGKVTINISGEDTYVYQAYSSANSYNQVTDSEIVLDGGIIGRFVGNSDRKYNAGMLKYGAAGATGTYTLYITKNFDFSKQIDLIGDASTGEFYHGLCGTTANKDFQNSVGDELLGTFIIKLDNEIVDAALAEQIKINFGSFDVKQKADGTEITGSGIHKPSNQPTVDKEDDKGDNNAKDTTPVSNAETKAPANDSTPATDATSQAAGGNAEGGIPVGVIIAIAAVVVVAGAVVVVVVLKKKKA